MSKLLSSCCQARAKVDMTGASTYFCSKCGEGCSTAQKQKPRSTLSTVRKVTGERELFVTLWARCGGKSQISNDPLLPPEHPLFHFQGSHILGQQAWPEFELREDNVVMCTIDEHDYYTNEPKKCREDPAWKWVWEQRARLQLEAELKRKPLYVAPAKGIGAAERSEGPKDGTHGKPGADRHSPKEEGKELEPGKYRRSGNC